MSAVWMPVVIFDLVILDLVDLDLAVLDLAVFGPGYFGPGYFGIHVVDLDYHDRLFFDLLKNRKRFNYHMDVSD